MLHDKINFLTKYSDFRNNSWPPLWGLFHIHIGQGHINIDVNKITMSSMTRNSAMV